MSALPKMATGNIDAPVRIWIRESKRIVVLTGAGISTESGIPDFRGPQGMWTKDPEAEKLSDIHYYVADPEVRKKSWQARLAHPAWAARPNAGHMAIVELERRGKLHALITQNIDGLHQKAGNSPGRVIEVHGTVHKVVCLSCGWKGPMPATLDRVRSGEADPACKDCGGILKSDTISFGQALAPEVIERAMRAAAEADLLLSVGTSLKVYPIAGAVPAAKQAGARVVIVNAQPTPFDGIADAVLRSAIGETLPRIVETHDETRL
ncbi:MAG TPA: Sir2 family NAD-dependent protein deacetylase [Burkholderiales bacterium]|nr:Sir2 family NAD-dependent protein deacetylase [Burkholderiales bacterium]